MKNHRLSKGPLILLFFLLLPIALAQESDNPAPPGLLIRGPLERRGIPLGSPNAVPCRHALYHWGEESYEVSLVDLLLEMGEAWEPLRRGQLRLLKRKTADGMVFYYLDPKGWAVFITSPGASEERLGLFTEKFVERFSYFQAISGGFSFPAVLEIEAEG